MSVPQTPGRPGPADPTSPLRQSSMTAFNSSAPCTPTTPLSPFRATSTAIPLRSSPNSSPGSPGSPSALGSPATSPNAKRVLAFGTGRVKRIPLIYPKIDSKTELTPPEQKIVEGVQKAEVLLDHALRDGASVYELEAVGHMFPKFTEASYFLELLMRRFTTMPARRTALSRLLEIWVENRLIPDFLEPFTNKKGQKCDRQRVTYRRLLRFLKHPALSTNVGFDTATRIKFAILRAMQKHKGTSVGPQQEMAVANQKQLPNAREQEYEERLFLVYVALPPAKQVALSISAYDAVLMRQIGACDFMGLNWRNKSSPHPAKSVYEMIARSNNLSFWVASRILRHSKSTERRAETIVLFILIAKALKDMGNLNSVVGMLGGLNHGCVQRLRKAWDVVPQAHLQTFADLEAFVDSVGNYRNYRPYLQELAKRSDPAIPYLGVYLRDLVFMEDGMPTVTKEGKPNLEKIEVMRKVVEEMHLFGRTTAKAYPSPTPFAKFTAFAHVRDRARFNAGTKADLDSDNVDAYFACLHGRSEDELDALSYAAEPKATKQMDAPSETSLHSHVKGRDLKDYQGQGSEHSEKDGASQQSKSKSKKP